MVEKMAFLRLICFLLVDAERGMRTTSSIQFWTPVHVLLHDVEKISIVHVHPKTSHLLPEHHLSWHCLSPAIVDQESLCPDLASWWGCLAI